MSGDILELIDNAIDGATGPDAMRWTPEKPAGAPQVDRDALEAALQAVFAAAIARVEAAFKLLEPVLNQIGRNLTAAFASFEKFRPALQGYAASRRARVSRMHAAYGRRRRTGR